MGHEILYCYQCRSRIVGTEFANGHAFQVGDRVSCSKCAADLLQSLDAKEREHLLAKMFQATQDRQKHSSTKIPAVGATPPGPKALKPSTVRLTAVDSPTPRPGSPAVPIAVGAAVLVVGGLVLAVTLGRSPKPEVGKASRTEPAAVQRPAPPPTPAPAETAAQEAARLAVLKARDFVVNNPKDLEGQINLWRESLDAAAGTPFSAEARREMDGALARRKDVIPKDWAELQEQTRIHVEKKQVQAAIELLQSARSRYSVPEWTQPLDRQLGALHRSLPPILPAPVPQVNVAPAPAPAPPRPALPPAEAAAFGRASARDYAAALEQLKGTPEVDALRAAASVLQETQELLSKWPRGQNLSVELRDAGEVEGTVVRTDAGRVALKGAGWIEIGEITPGSLAAIFRARPAKKPQGDDRAAALFCLLEGDVDAARQILGERKAEIPEKLWQYGATVGELLLSPKESDARDLWRSSEEGVADYTRTGPSVELCRMLLRDHAGTAFVARNRAAIASRAAGGTEYLFCTENLKTAGTWKPSRTAKVESCWTCEKDGIGNTVDLTFTAFPNTEYRCWVYVGACCQETFSFSAQGTEMKTGEPGTPGMAPVKLNLIGLKKTHAMHTGPKSPSTWGWIPIPLPRYAGSGVKTVRLVTDQQGFSIAFAAVTAQKEQPRDSDLKEFERTLRELGGARKAAAPARPGKVIFSHDFSKGVGRFKVLGGAVEIVDAEPGGPKAIAIPPKGAEVRGFEVVTKPSTVVRFRLKSLIDLDLFECMSWIDGKGANAWVHVANLKKGEWRTVEFKLGDLQLNYNGAAIMGTTVNSLTFYYLNRPDDSRILLTDFEIRD